MYNGQTNTIFTLLGELGFTLHEMHEISVLSTGKTPYVEIIPSVKELLCLKTIPNAYSTNWELMCHYYICVDISKMRGQVVHHKAWA